MIYKTAAVFFIFFAVCLKAANPGGLVASYTFNKGLVKDGSGRNHPKISEGILIDDRFGNKRSALYLYGNQGSYMDLGTSPVLKQPQMSICMWFYIETIVYRGKGIPTNPLIIAKNLQGDDFMESYIIGYDYNAKKINAGLAIDSTQQISITSTEHTSLREWHHIALAFNDDSLWLYIDGKLENANKAIRKAFHSIYSPTLPVIIGNTANKKNDRYFCGAVDDIFIYDRVITREEALELYNAPDYNRYNVYLKWLYWCLGSMAAIAVITWLIVRRYKNDLEKQKERNRINSRLSELETKAIRTQMNPHFIFNSLNTLQRFILEEDFPNSNLYLTKFSLLLRKLIESSVSDFISLSEEIAILASYIEIESMRFEHAFEYSIENTIASPDSVYIPFMLVQPFVENAIWHGLLPKKGMRCVKIIFSTMDADRILCEVDDNGIGRVQVSESKNPLKQKSLAIDFIKQRLELLERSTGISCSFVIVDKKDENGQPAGTKVNIIIPKLKYENTRSHN